MSKTRLAIVFLPVIALVLIGLPFAVVSVLCSVVIQAVVVAGNWLTGGFPIITKAPTITPESHQLGGASWG